MIGLVSHIQDLSYLDWVDFDTYGLLALVHLSLTALMKIGFGNLMLGLDGSYRKRCRGDDASDNSSHTPYLLKQAATISLSSALFVLSPRALDLPILP